MFDYIMSHCGKACVRISPFSGSVPPRTCPGLKMRPGHIHMINASNLLVCIIYSLLPYLYDH